MELFGVILDSLLIVLVIILIILALKAIETLTKVNIILDITKEKLDNLNTIFNMIDTVNSSLTIITDTVIGSAMNFIGSIFKRKKEEKENNE